MMVMLGWRVWDCFLPYPKYVKQNLRVIDEGHGMHQTNDAEMTEHDSDKDERAESDDQFVPETQNYDSPSFTNPSFSLSQRLISNLARQELTIPTPVQLSVIPKVRNPRGPDLCVNAPTGSGKTLAYALPITQVVQVDDH